MEVGYGENKTLEECKKFCDEMESCNSFKWCDDVCYLNDNKIIAEMELFNKSAGCVTAYKYCETGKETKSKGV